MACSLMEIRRSPGPSEATNHQDFLVMFPDVKTGGLAMVHRLTLDREVLAAELAAFLTQQEGRSETALRRVGPHPTKD